MGYLIILIILGIILSIWLFKYKFPKVGSMALITGGVKAGKSTFAVALAISKYKWARIGWHIDKILCKILFKKSPEEPLIYSNVPLKTKWGYVPITTDLIMREKRFNYKSVIYINEASLLHDKDIYKDMSASTRIALFNKLIGHETKGGCIIYDTQCIGDLPVGVRRCLSEYFYIHHMIKWIPFILIAYVREDRYSEDGTIQSTNTADVEESLRKVIIRKSTWKKFDCYCWSIFTDNKPVVNEKAVRSKDLKARNFVTFQHEYIKHLKIEEENNNETKVN